MLWLRQTVITANDKRLWRRQTQLEERTDRHFRTVWTKLDQTEQDHRKMEDDRTETEMTDELSEGKTGPKKKRKINMIFSDMFKPIFNIRVDYRCS